MKLGFSKYNLNIRFNEKLSSGSRIVPCGRTDRQTDITKIIVVFRNFVKSPKICETKVADDTWHTCCDQ